MNKELIDKLNKEGFVVCNAEGNSMLPFLHHGDKVVINKINEKIKISDVILYQSKENYVLHRVVDIKNNIIFARGDNTETIEEISIDNVLGVLSGYYNENGYIEISDLFNKYNYYRSQIKYLLRKLR